MGKINFSIRSVKEKKDFLLDWKPLVRLSAIEELAQVVDQTSEAEKRAIRALEDLHSRGVGILQPMLIPEDELQASPALSLCVAVPIPCAPGTLRGKTMGKNIDSVSTQWGWECVRLAPHIEALTSLCARAGVWFNASAVLRIANMPQDWVVRQKDASLFASQTMYVLYSPVEEVFMGPQGGWVDSFVNARFFECIFDAEEEAGKVLKKFQYIPLEMTVGLSGRAPLQQGPLIQEALALQTKTILEKELAQPSEEASNVGSKTKNTKKM